MVYTYVLKSKKDGKWYTGFTHNLRERFKQHNDSEVFSTKGRGPFEIIYYEACVDEHDAAVREKYLKSGMGKRYLKNRLKRSLFLTGFTLVELLVTITIIAVLSSIILFSIGQYINKSKDASIQGNLSSLVPAGEIYYDHNGTNGYGTGANNNGTVSGNSFCGSSVVENSFSQIASAKYCNATRNAWAACAQEFINDERAFCVDSRGYKREICNNSCTASITICEDNLTGCQ